MVESIECRKLTNWFFFCTVIGMGSFIILPGIGVLLLHVGAYSMYAAFGSFGFADSANEVLMGLIWMVLFFAILVAGYLMTRKGLYGLFIVTLIMDALYVAISAIYQLLIGNSAGFSVFATDIAVNIVFIVLFMHYYIKHKKGMRSKGLNKPIE